MARMRRYVKFLTHIFYIIFLSYIITQRSQKKFTVRNIDRFLSDLKNILIWSHIQGINQDGQVPLITRQCRSINCYFTKNRSLFGDLRYFDAVVFNLQDVTTGTYDLPQIRGINQKYIFAANDSADNYPVCCPTYDNFFNWTWSYRSDSTVIYRFISVYNIHDEELGTHFQWKNNMEPINLFLKHQFRSKSKAAAIFLDKCESRSQREDLVKRLQKQLAKFNLTVDVFGKCGTMVCKRKTMSPCQWLLRKNYYFYLALEDSFADEYITDSVLHAYKSNAVPIVYGGANYDDFLPPGSYLNAMLYTDETLAKKMNEVIHNKPLYYEYFRWKNHYVMKESQVLDVCALCKLLNNPTWLTHRISYTYFRKWWNPKYQRRCRDDSFFSLL